MSDSQVTLYDHGASSYAQKVRIVLREKGIPFKSILPSDLSNMNNSGPLHDSNPRLEVPVLIHEGNTIFDSTIILEYLEERFPEVPLLPKAPGERARARMIEDMVDTHYEACNWGISEVENFGRAEGPLRDAILKQGEYHTRELQQWLTEKLGSAPWFGGEQFGWADAAVASIVNRSVTYGLGPDPSTPLGKWHARLRERPSVAETFKEYEAAFAGMSMVKERLDNRQMRRQYRDHRLEWMIKAGGFNVVKQGLEKDNIRFTWPYNS